MQRPRSLQLSLTRTCCFLLALCLTENLLWIRRASALSDAPPSRIGTFADSMGSVSHEVDPMENPKANRRKQPSHGGAERLWDRDREEAEDRVGTRGNVRRASYGQEADGTASENKGNGTHHRKSVGDGGEPRNGANVSKQSYGLEGVHERLLWDELRESLAGVTTGGEGLLPRGQDGVRDFEKTVRGRAGEEQRRRLIDEAISVLLEASSDEEGVERGSL